MRSFHYLSVTSCVFSFFCSQLVTASGAQSSKHDRSRSLVHKRAPSRNYEPHVLSVDQSGDMIFSKRSQFTYFQDGQGACGSYNTPSDFIVALNSCDYDGGAHCFKTITITINGKSTQAQITDECPGCPCGGLDFSQGLFEFFAPTSVGELSGSWTYGNGVSTTSTPLPSTTTSTSTWTPPSTTSLSSTSNTIATTSTPITTSMSTTTSASLPSTVTSSTASPNPTFNPNDPQMLTQVNLALIEFGSVLQACAAMSF